MLPSLELFVCSWDSDSRSQRPALGSMMQKKRCALEEQLSGVGKQYFHDTERILCRNHTYWRHFSFLLKKKKKEEKTKSDILVSC